MRMCSSKRTPAVSRDLFVLKNRSKVGTGMSLTTKGIDLKMITWNDSSLILKPAVQACNAQRHIHSRLLSEVHTLSKYCWRKTECLSYIQSRWRPEASRACPTNRSRFPCQDLASFIGRQCCLWSMVTVLEPGLGGAHTWSERVGEKSSTLRGKKRVPICSEYRTWLGNNIFWLEGTRKMTVTITYWDNGN